MAIKKLVFSYPPSLVEEPVTYKLVKDFDLQVNILRATVRPRESGRMVVELKGSRDNMAKAVDYLEDQGVEIDTLVQELRYRSERCVHCTACTAVCPTGALSVEPKTRELIFDHGKCIICEACIPTCSYGAIESQF